MCSAWAFSASSKKHSANLCTLFSTVLIHSLSHSHVSAVDSTCSSPYWPSKSGEYPVCITESWSTSSLFLIIPSEMSGNASEGVYLCGSLHLLHNCFPQSTYAWTINKRGLCVMQSLPLRKTHFSSHTHTHTFQHMYPFCDSSGPTPRHCIKYIVAYCLVVTWTGKSCDF